jgi:hypothetical protein
MPQPVMALIAFYVGEDRLLRIRNIDSSMSDTIRFLHNWGFAEVVSQYEMIKDLE